MTGSKRQPRQKLTKGQQHMLDVRYNHVKWRFKTRFGIEYNSKVKRIVSDQVHDKTTLLGWQTRTRSLHRVMVYGETIYVIWDHRRWCPRTVLTQGQYEARDPLTIPQGYSENEIDDWTEEDNGQSEGVESSKLTN